jgi:hypothetical protein
VLNKRIAYYTPLTAKCKQKMSGNRRFFPGFPLNLLRTRLFFLEFPDVQGSCGIQNGDARHAHVGKDGLPHGGHTQRALAPEPVP